MLKGMPTWAQLLIVIAALGIFQMVIIQLSSQNTELFGQLKRSIR